jgi:hypothetical protein
LSFGEKIEMMEALRSRLMPVCNRRNSWYDRRHDGSVMAKGLAAFVVCDQTFPSDTDTMCPSPISW